MKHRLSAGLCVGICLSALSLLGAELNVNLDVSFKENARDGVGAGSQAHERRATIFVIDRSGSMNERDQLGGKTRWDALLEGVKSDLDGLPDGDAVGLVIFQTEVMPAQTFSGSVLKRGTEYRVLDSAAARGEILKRVTDNPPARGRANGSWIGATALYDALADASELARRLGDTGVSSVQILVHSDGQDTSSRRFKKFKDVQAKYGIIWEQFKELKIVGSWWGGANEIPSDMYQFFSKKSGSVYLNLPKTRLQNPVVMGTQSVDLQVVVEAPRDLWREFEGKDVNLSLQLGRYGGTDSVFPLKAGKFTLTLPLPVDLPKNQETLGTLKINGLPQSEKLNLPDPNPISIIFEKPGEVSLRVLQPRRDLRVLKGDVVDFRVDSTPNAVLKWQFNGMDVGAEPALSKKLDETVAYVVTAEKPGMVEARVAGKVEVVDADIQIQKPALNPRVGEPATFKAVTRGTAKAIQWL